MTMRVLILGAGFGGLELSTSLSEALRAAKEQFGSSRRSRWFGR
jgi:NADH dehydrogenase FAD-containing subunit